MCFIRLFLCEENYCLTALNTAVHRSHFALLSTALLLNNLRAQWLRYVTLGLKLKVQLFAQRIHLCVCVLFFYSRRNSGPNF